MLALRKFRLDRQLPHALITRRNPVFEYDLRRVRWLRTPKGLRRYSFYLLIGIPLALIILELSNAISYGSTVFKNGYYVDHLAADLVWLIALATIAVVFVADMYYLAVTIASLNRLIDSGQWDVLRLTALRQEDLLLAKYAIAQTRGWRMMVVDMAFRLLGIVFVLLQIAFHALDIWTIMVSYPILSIGAVGFLFVGSAGYLLEPLWRMRTIIALGMAVSAWLRNLTFATLTAMGLLLAMRIAQGIILVSILWGMQFIFALASTLDGGFHTDAGAFGGLYLFTSAAYILTALALGYAMYVFYRRLRRYALERAFRHAFQSD